MFYLPGAEHSTTWLPAWRSQGLISDREKFSQSVSGITHGYFPESDQLLYMYSYDGTIIV